MNGKMILLQICFVCITFCQFFTIHRRDFSRCESVHVGVDDGIIVYGKNEEDMDILSRMNQDNGSISWTKTVETSSSIDISFIRFTSSEAFLISGINRNSTGRSTSFISKFDSDLGTIHWSVDLLFAVESNSTTKRSLNITDVAEVNQTKTLFCGYEEEISGQVDANISFIGVVNQIGNVTFYVKTNLYKCLKILNATTEGFYVIGSFKKDSETDIIITKISTNYESIFQIEWSKIIVRNIKLSFETSFKFITSEHQIFFLGRNETNDNFFIASLSSLGVMEWIRNFEKSYPLNLTDLHIHDNFEDLIVTGFYSNPTPELIVLKIDKSNGNLKYSRNYPFPSERVGGGMSGPIPQLGMFVSYLDSSSHIVVGEVNNTGSSSIAIHHFLNSEGKSCEYIDTTSSIISNSFLSLSPSPLLSFDDFISFTPKTMIVSELNSELFQFKNIESEELTYLCVSCFGISWNSTQTVCSGYGNCESVDKCTCDQFYNSKKDCSQRSIPLFVKSLGGVEDDVALGVIRTKVFKSSENGRIVLLGRTTISSELYYTLYFFKEDFETRRLVLDFKRAFRPSGTIVAPPPYAPAPSYLADKPPNYGLESFGETSGGDILMGLSIIKSGKYNHAVMRFDTFSKSIDKSCYYSSGGHDVMTSSTFIDDSIITAGRSDTWGPHSSINVGIIKTNQYGNKVWSRVLDVTTEIESFGVRGLKNKDFVIGISALRTIHYIESTASIPVTWGKKFDNNRYSAIYFHQDFDDDETDDIYFCGKYISGSSPNYVFYLLVGRFARNGATLKYTKILGSGGEDWFCKSMVFVKDYLMIFASTDRYNPSFNNVIMKFQKSDGAVIWARKFTSINEEIYGDGYYDKFDDSILISGSVYQPTRGNNILLRKLDANTGLGCDTVDITSDIIGHITNYNTNNWDNFDWPLDGSGQGEFGITNPTRTPASGSTSVDMESDQVIEIAETICECEGVLRYDPSVCNANGTCSNDGTCECHSGFFQEDCLVYGCAGYRYTETDLVCRGHGTCIPFQDYCICDDGYEFGTPFGIHGLFCSKKYECFGKYSNDTDGRGGFNPDYVCSGVGICVGDDNCDCSFSDYEGQECNKRKYPHKVITLGRDSNDDSSYVFQTKVYKKEDGGRTVVIGSTYMYSKENLVLYFYKKDWSLENKVMITLTYDLDDFVGESGILRDLSTRFVVETSDGNFLIASSCLIDISSVLVKVHFVSSFNPTLMEIDWKQQYSSSDNSDTIMNIATSVDGGDAILTSGKSSGWGGDSSDVVIFKTAKDQSFVWGRLLNTSNSIETYDLMELQQEGEGKDIIVAVGGSPGNTDTILRLAQNVSVILWQRTMDVDHRFYRIYEDYGWGGTNDIFFCGSHYINSDVEHLIYGRMTTSGELVWINKVTGTAKTSCRHGGIVGTADGNIVIVGISDQLSTEFVGAALKFKKNNGDLIWARVFDETITKKEILTKPLYDRLDNSLIIIGETERHIDIWRSRDALYTRLDGTDGTNCETINVTDYIQLGLNSYSVSWGVGSLLLKSITPNIHYKPVNVFKTFDVSVNSKFCKCEGNYLLSDSVCNYHNGSCNSELGVCECYSGYFGKDCTIFNCHSKLSNDTENVCLGHGNCVDHNLCECFVGYLPPYCTYNYSCNGISYLNDSFVCGGGRGECVLGGPYIPGMEGKCDCFIGYTGLNCEDFDCFGIKKNDTTYVCSGKGNCTSRNLCVCESGFYEEQCNITSCFGYPSNESTLVCSGHGVCNFLNNCSCSDPFHGENCEYATCFGESSSDDNNVCGGHGNCEDVDECVCDGGYQNIMYQGNPKGPCNLWTCNTISNTATGKVCSGNGKCISYDRCNCIEDYEGEDCSEFRCNHIFKSSSKVCSGHGECTNPDVCECEGAYFGTYCDLSTVAISVLTPIGGLSILFTLLVVFFICVCVCCVIFLCCILLCVSCVMVVRLVGKTKKFEKLQDFDILLKEQQLEKERGLDHIKINKSLFEVDYDEIKIMGILGEGGSSSVVYKAKWKGQIVAFKCFKTRNLFANQDSFDEFENEVEVLANISHPNVINFFGCSLKPPRVGILMEFAAHGDMNIYILKHEMKYGIKFPIEEKVRVLYETASALDYLHSRNIIHRDLKCENVLLDEKNRAKVMDFGLSRIVEEMSAVKTSRIGTNVYMAPEIVTSGNYDEKCDVFSFAIMVYVVITEAFNPYGNVPGIEIKVANDPNFRPELDILDESLEGEQEFNWIKGLVTKCWNHESSNRYSFKEISTFIEDKRERKEEKIEQNKNEEDDGEKEEEERSTRDFDEEKDEKNWKKEAEDLERLLKEFFQEKDYNYSEFIEFKGKKDGNYEDQFDQWT